MNNEELIMDNKKYNDVGVGLVPAQRNINKTQCKRCSGEHSSSAKENRTNFNANGVGICWYATQKGITLIALIITIIILLILAGVTINVLIGDNSLFNTASRAGEKYEKEAIKEELESAILDIQLSKNMNITMQDIIDELPIKCPGVEWIDIDLKEPIGEYKEYEFKVSDDYTVEIVGKVKGDRPISKIIFEKESVSIGKDSTEGLQLKYTIEPKNATNKEVVWEVENPDLLTVTDGKIVAKGIEGQTKVTCKALYGDVSTVCNVNIIDAAFIYTPEDLINKFGSFAKYNSVDGWIDYGHYYIMNDIDMSGYEYTTKDMTFKGVLEGNGHTISNLKIEGAQGERGIGLTKKADGATYKNLLFKDVYISGTTHYVGVLAGNAYYKNTVDKVGITGTIMGYSIGSFFGSCSLTEGLNKLSFTNCYARTKLIGYNQYDQGRLF